jgi:hypothetical protein
MKLTCPSYMVDKLLEEQQRREGSISINQSTSWHLPVCLIDDILLVYSRGDQRSSRGEMVIN